MTFTSRNSDGHGVSSKRRHTGIALGGLGAVVSTIAVLTVSPALAQDGMAAAQALVTEASQTPVFVDPGPAFDARACMADRSIFVIPLTSQNPFNVEIARGQTEAAEAIGFELTVWDNQLNVDQWVQGIATAINGGYDVIDLQGGVPPAALGPQIAEARDAGLKVVTTHLNDVTQEPDSQLDGAFAMNYTRAGQIMAAWAMLQTDGEVNAVIIGSDEIMPTSAFVNAIETYLDENCPNCQHRYVNVPVVEWGSGIQTEVQSALVADPSINYILPIYDSMSQFIVPALELTGRDDVRIATYNGTPFVLDLLREGDLVEMNVGESLGWVGWSGVDATMRLLCDEGTVTELNTPLYVFSDENVETAGVPATYTQGYGDGYIDGFRALWGLD
ncbi:MAG: substrate-binding domain-containing protein [Pseudomonadota bacterium]